MKSKIKKLDGTASQIDVILPAETVSKALDEVMSEIKKSAKIPGFREGKAPIDLVYKKHKDDAMDEVKRRLVPEAYQSAVSEHKISPVSYPEIFDIVLHEEGSLSFKAKVDSHPEVKLKNYKGIKVSSEKVSVDDKEVDETVDRIRNMNAEFKDAERAIEKKDFGLCDVEVFVEEKPITKKQQNMWIEADKDSSLLGLGEQLCGMKKGDLKSIEATLPENYPDKKYAGKSAIFKVEVKGVKEKILPNIDDELAKKAGKESLNELREDIKSQLLERKTLNNNINMKNQILEYLINKHTFDVPSSMVKRQLSVLLEKAEHELLTKGVSKDVINSQKDSLKEKLLPEAENKVRVYFILDKIAQEENIGVTDEEIDRYIEEQAKAYEQPLENVKKYYVENDLVEGLKEQLREDKTLDILLGEASVESK